MSVEPVPDWLRPVGGFLAADLDHLPGLPPHTELIDGGLVLMSPQRRFHDRALFRLQMGLVASLPPHLDVAREMSIVLGDRQRPVPDLSVIALEATGDGTETSYPASVTELVVEVVSPESLERDRGRKPQLYAGAGIPHFWRVEDDGGEPVVYVYQLDVSHYRLTGIFHEKLEIAVPYPIMINLAGTLGER